MSVGKDHLLFFMAVPFIACTFKAAFSKDVTGDKICLLGSVHFLRQNVPASGEQCSGSFPLGFCRSLGFQTLPCDLA